MIITLLYFNHDAVALIMEDEIQCEDLLACNSLRLGDQYPSGALECPAAVSLEKNNISEVRTRCRQEVRDTDLSPQNF